RNSLGPSIFFPSASVPTASIGAPFASVLRHLPTASKFSRAKPAGSITRWHVAQAGLLRCCSSCSRTVFGAFTSLLLSSRVGTFGGGGGGGVSRKVLSTYLPRNTGEVRVATDVIERMLPCPSRPRRFGSGIFTFRNRGPYTPGIP